MKVSPTQVKGVCATTGAAPARKSAAPAPATPPVAAPVDHVELSSAAQALAQTHAARIAELTQRVSSGFYDRPAMRAQVVDRLTHDVTRADDGDA